MSTKSGKGKSPAGGGAGAGGAKKAGGGKAGSPPSSGAKASAKEPGKAKPATKASGGGASGMTGGTGKQKAEAAKGKTGAKSEAAKPAAGKSGGKAKSGAASDSKADGAKGDAVKGKSATGAASKSSSSKGSSSKSSSQKSGAAKGGAAKGAVAKNAAGSSSAAKDGAAGGDDAPPRPRIQLVQRSTIDPKSDGSRAQAFEAHGGLPARAALVAAKKRRFQKLTADQIDRFRERLLELRSTLSNDLDLMANEALKGTGQDPGQDNMADHGTDNFEQDFTLTLMENEGLRLREIELALERLEEGQFGRCEGCQGAIPMARLETIPYTRYCITCQQEQEANPE